MGVWAGVTGLGLSPSSATHWRREPGTVGDGGVEGSTVRCSVKVRDNDQHFSLAHVGPQSATKAFGLMGLMIHPVPVPGTFPRKAGFLLNGVAAWE